MKKIALLMFVLMSCNSTAKKVEYNTSAIKKDSGRVICIVKTAHADYEGNYDSILSVYSKTFNPVTLELNKSISHKLKTFLQEADTGCLKKASNYKLFIATVISKQVLFELKCCNQNYDLLQMDGEAAKFIVNDYVRMAGYGGQHLEMLNCGTVDSFILNDEALKNSKELKQILKNRITHLVSKAKVGIILIPIYLVF